MGDPRIDRLLVGHDTEEEPPLVGRLILAFMGDAYGPPGTLDLIRGMDFKEAIWTAVSGLWGVYYFAGVRVDGIEEPLYAGRCGMAHHERDMREDGLRDRLANGKHDKKPRTREYLRWLDSGSDDEAAERHYRALRLRWWVTTHGRGDGTLPALAEAQVAQIIYRTNAARPLRYQKAL